MTKRSKKPLLIPIFMTLIISSIALLTFFSAQQVQVELPQYPEIRPNLSQDGSNFYGFIDITIPYNISNRSPAFLKNGKIDASMSVVSIEGIGLFPDTTILNISEEIPTIKPNDFVPHVLQVKISSWIPILAIMDAYLVLDIDLSLTYQLGPFNFPVHLIARLQDMWIAPFSI
jgi:hypothetical protein